MLSWGIGPILTGDTVAGRPLRRSREARRRNAPKLPTASQLQKLVEARGRYFTALRLRAEPRIEERMLAAYHKALAPVLKRLEAEYLSDANQREVDARAHAWRAKRVMEGPGVDW
jgi:hypothetical protein